MPESVQKYIVALSPDADYDATKQTIEDQGGKIVDDTMRILGMITVEMSDEGASCLKSLTSDVISVEPDQQVSTQAAA
ncbi:hypothetical protein DEU56DRAFT_977567 [Suillus clintonianus]|uniref:uncharacterized protein n=1 Tax=Suillus clintonianus TaxID=1904413 RepID=UPI001B882356|nr:uncharacterized protein DEU56DRAFT_977567 [Suillus clintonianus]KAG2150849.1 hypothetical protein DEU56DRAFT_977567 [Suillus clintonianus]